MKVRDIARPKITPVHGRNYSDYTRRVGLAPRGVDSGGGARESGCGVVHSAATASITNAGKRGTDAERFAQRLL